MYVLSQLTKRRNTSTVSLVIVYNNILIFKYTLCI